MKILPGLEKSRKNAALTQADVASKLGINVCTVVRWEKGTKLPDVLTLIELSRIFNQSIHYIVTGKEFASK